MNRDNLLPRHGCGSWVVAASYHARPREGLRASCHSCASRCRGPAGGEALAGPFCVSGHRTVKRDAAGCVGAEGRRGASLLRHPATPLALASVRAFSWASGLRFRPRPTGSSSKGRDAYHLMQTKMADSASSANPLVMLGRTIVTSRRITNVTFSQDPFARYAYMRPRA